MLFYYVLCHLCPLKLNSLKLISLSTLVSPQIKNVLKLSHNSNSIYRQQKSPLPFSPYSPFFGFLFYFPSFVRSISPPQAPPFVQSNLTSVRPIKSHHHPNPNVQNLMANHNQITTAWTTVRPRHLTKPINHLSGTSTTTSLLLTLSSSARAPPSCLLVLPHCFQLRSSSYSLL